MSANLIFRAATRLAIGVNVAAPLENYRDTVPRRRLAHLLTNLAGVSLWYVPRGSRCTAWPLPADFDWSG